MHLHEIKIKNFKGFADSTFSFADPFTVVVGDNATGKTALLDAVAVAIGGWLSDLALGASRDIGEKEIRRLHVSDFSIEQVFPVEITANFNWDKLFDLATKRGITSKGSPTKTLDKKDEWQILTKKYLDNIDFKLKYLKPLPVFAYFGTGRLWVEHVTIEYSQRGSRYDAYAQALSPQSSSKTFLAWYKTIEDELSKFDKVSDRLLLKALKEAITIMVPSWEDIAFSHAENDLMGKYQKEDGTFAWMPFSLLSDGYRNLIGMVADIAWRCITLNGFLLERAVSASQGIVLIDELDLHLHPKWQRTVVQDLQRAFPSMQFITTTHSPFIVQSLRAEQLINLDGIEPATDPNKRSLTESALLMGVPSENSEVFNEKMELAGDIFEKLNSADATEADIDELMSKAEDQFSDDPAFIAKMQFEKLAKIGS